MIPEAVVHANEARSAAGCANGQWTQVVAGGVKSHKCTATIPVAILSLTPSVRRTSLQCVSSLFSNLPACELPMSNRSGSFGGAALAPKARISWRVILSISLLSCGYLLTLPTSLMSLDVCCCTLSVCRW